AGHAGPHADRRGRVHRRRCAAARGGDRPGARPRDRRAVHGGDLAALVHFGHIRQLDKVTELMLTGAWAVGAGPGDRPMFIDLDSTVCEVHGYAKQGAGYGYTVSSVPTVAGDTGRDRRGPPRPDA